MRDDTYDRSGFDLLEIDAIKCTKCGKKTDAKTWLAVEVSCERCGGHWAIICPECEMGFYQFEDFDDLRKSSSQQEV